MRATGDVERCPTCVLPRSSYLEYDDQGVCSVCTALKRSGVQAETLDPDDGELDLHIERIRQKGQGREYDCLAGISGGRDSTHLLYRLVKKHNLRCLACYYRTPFTPDAIDSNVRKIVAELDVPLVEMHISQEYHRRVAREIVMLWRKNPLPAIASLACAPCKLVNREAFRIAREQGVAWIVFGGNKYEAFQLGAGQVQRADAKKRFSFAAQSQEVVLSAAKGLELLAKATGAWRFVPIGFQATILYRSPHTSYLRLRYPEVGRMDYFLHAEWEESESEQVLAELGWQLPPGCNSTWKADCEFAELKNYMFRATTGLTYMDAFLSNLVRAGILSREEALRRVEVEGRMSPERLARVLRVLELPEDFLPPLE
jgi:hypothetical protein